MQILSLSFISVERRFAYRLALEIALIVSLLVAVSGIINGVSGQFSLLIIQNTQGSNKSFIVLEHSKVLEDSNISSQVINSVDQSYLNFFTPILVLPAQINASFQEKYYFVDLNQLLKNEGNFVIISGTQPTNSSQILIGKGLATQLEINNTLPRNISIIIDGKMFIREIVGIFQDNNPWYYGFLDDLTHYWSNLTYISGFEFEIKNSAVLPAFEQQLYLAINTNGIHIELDFIPLKQSNELSISFYNELKDLFMYLFDFLSLLLLLKLFHSVYTLLNRFEQEIWICKIIGMSNWQIKNIFWQIIVIIGNTGIFCGILIGILLPEFLFFGIKIVLSGTSLFIIPSLNDIVLIFTIINIQFLVTSILAFTARNRIKINKLIQ